MCNACSELQKAYEEMDKEMDLIFREKTFDEKAIQDARDWAQQENRAYSTLTVLGPPSEKEEERILCIKEHLDFLDQHLAKAQARYKIITEIQNGAF